MATVPPFLVPPSLTLPFISRSFRCHRQNGPSAAAASDGGFGDQLWVAAVPGLERADPARQGLLQDGAHGERFLRPGRRRKGGQGESNRYKYRPINSADILPI